MCLLGLDFLHNYKVDIKLSTNTISINGEEIYASVVRSGETDIKVSRIKLARRVVIPPNTVQIVTGEAEHNLERDVILQPVNQHKHLLMPHSVGKCSNKEVPVRVCNPTDEYVTLKKGYHVGYLEEVDEIFKGETSYRAHSPVDEQPAGLDSKAFVRRCTVSEANVLVDEQSVWAGTKLGNPVDEQSAGATGGSEKPGDEQSPGSTKEKSVKE